MNAIELSEKLEQQFPTGTSQGYLDGEAAAMLRKQHKAIKVLREAIEASMSSSQWAYTGYIVRGRIEQALKDTEEFK